MKQEAIKLLYNISTWDKIGLNFWGIPKSGNTSIKFLLHEVSGNQIEACDDKNQWVHHHKYTTYITPEQAFKNNYTNIAVVRNPYDRFISMFKDVKRRGEIFSLHDHDTVDKFLSYLEKTPNRNRNLHFKTQKSFLYDNVKCIDITDEDNLHLFLNHPIPHKNSIDDKVVLTDDMKQRVYELYEEDFTYLGYTK